ncbi:Fused nickel transport protein NikMN [Rhodovastum atsumiense]|uniref:Cobalt transporter CbiM n=1 Tax=Rhodovastum atsumiense TaxID=504468 RepID=A0A5M6IZP8_9PROT|nr:cobalt transporter CbiM [Rhodovastum atsumiense]KAA5612855.1 cobalt transporter CbiM [Rhodovastum atsumiense]CAH2601077.1 Fused nickel transport protein NikMN [Rhodovastum atsumiense]
MHIPDGYLSPASCAVAYAVAIPFWSVALRRVERLLHTRAVPLLAVVSAFSFVIMMFNLPLPGGTTGHAVGIAIATILLGPWASMVSISIALLIQAVFFGDGGITTFGANCLNMAIVGSLVAHATYGLLAGKAAIDSPRRVLAAGLAGYLAINAAALLTALEFGVQPMLFHDATGAPLYAPYPLSIAVPAMMIGHLTIAGLAELVISAGLVAWLQRTHPELLARPGHDDAAERRPVAAASGWRATRRLWIGLAALMVASPLGLLAAGIAWGEWGVEDFSDPVLREQILHASGNVAPPEAVPQGLERLASLWAAPLPDYAPGFLANAQLGYIVSAATGALLILLAFGLMAMLRARRATPQPDAN